MLLPENGYKFWVLWHDKMVHIYRKCLKYELLWILNSVQYSNSPVFTPVFSKCVCNLNKSFWLSNKTQVFEIWTKSSDFRHLQKYHAKTKDMYYTFFSNVSEYTFLSSTLIYSLSYPLLGATPFSGLLILFFITTLATHPCARESCWVMLSPC